MKLSAIFENIDAADQAIARLRQEGVTFRSPRQESQYPPYISDYQESRFFAFPTAYEPFSMIFPYETPHLNPAVLPYPEEYIPPYPARTVLSFDVPDYDANRAKDIIINQHGTNIRLS